MEQELRQRRNKAPKPKKGGKKRVQALALLDKSKLYSLKEAVALVRKMTFAKFNASVDIDIHTGLDPKKPDEAIRGTLSLPHGIGKEVKVLVLCQPENEQEALDAGADYAGFDEYVTKIKGGWFDFDVVVVTTAMMPKLNAAGLGRVLGPRGLMPNPKSGTVVSDIAKGVAEIKAGKIDFKLDKTGNIHSTVGRIAFTDEQLEENIKEFVSKVQSLKPQKLKGTYIYKIAISSTMSPSVVLDLGILRSEIA